MSLSHRTGFVGRVYYACLCLLAVVLLFASSGAASQSVLAATPQPTATVPTLGKTIVTDDKAFAIDYPADYVTQLAPHLVALGSSQDAMDEAFKSPPVISSGNVVFQIEYFPPGDQQSAGLDLSSTDALLNSLMKKANLQFGNMGSFTLGDIEGSRVSLQEKTFSGTVVSFFLDKMPFVAILLTAPDEAEQYNDLLDAITQTIRPNTGTPTSNATPIVASTDGVELGQTFTSKDLLVSLDYPDNWVIEANTGTPNLINLGSSKDALDQIAHQSSPKLTSGQIAIQLVYGDVLGRKFPMGLDASTPENLLNGILKNLPWKVGDIQPLTLGQYDAVRVDITDANLSGVFIAVTGGKLPVLAGIFTAPDEASTVEPILDAIVLSVRVNGDSTSAAPPEPEVTETAPTTSNDMTLAETFVSSDKSLSIQYPSGWVAQSTAPYSVSIGDSIKTVDLLNAESSPILESGHAGVQFNYIANASSTSGLDVSGDPAKLLKSLVAQVPSTIKLGEIEIDTLGKLDIARVTLTSDGLDAVVYAFFIGKTPVYAIAGAASGEFTDFQPTLEAMIMSVKLKLPAK